MTSLDHPLRIALFHNLPSGGAKRHTYEQVRELAGRGHHIEEFTFSTANREFMPLSDYARDTHVYPLKWIPLWRIGIPGLGPYIHLLQNLCNLRQLNRVSQQMATDMDAGHFDLVFAKDCMFTLAPQILRYVRTPSVFYAHSLLDGREDESEIISHTNLFTAWPIQRHIRLVRNIDLRNTQCAGLVLTNSQYTKQRLKRDRGVDAVVVYPGVDTENFHPAEKACANYVLSAGTVNEEKGHRLVLEALGLLPLELRPALIVAGNDPESEEAHYLRERASALGVGLTIQYVRSSEEMAYLYAHAQVLVIAPLYERLGLVALESMACGTPVIGVNQGGLLETVKDGVTGVLVERIPEALAGALRELLQDPNRAESMGRAGRAYIEAYWTWKRAVDDLEVQFAAVLGER